MRDRFLWIGTIVYAACFFILGVWKYTVHRNFVDFGIFLQTTASAFGCFCNAVEGSHYAYHNSPILLLPGALLLVWHSPYALIALQAIACALVAPPIAALVEARTNRNTARLVALLVWLNPALAGLAFVDFHENVFAPVAIVWMIWCFDAGRLRWAFVCALVAMAVKEDQALFVAITCAFVAWRFRRTNAGRYGLIGAIIGLNVALQFFRSTQPHMAAHMHWQPTRFYAWTGADLHSLLTYGVLERLGFIVLVFAPLAFVAFRSAMLWLAAAPLAEVLLSRMPTTYTLGTHYAGAWIGYVLVAFAFAFRRLSEGQRTLALRVAIAASILEFLVANPLHPGLTLRPYQNRDAHLDTFLATLPARYPVASQEEAYTHLALNDPYATVLPDNPSTTLAVCHVLVDYDFPHSPRLVEYGSTLDGMRKAKRLHIVRHDGAISLYSCSISGR